MKEKVISKNEGLFDRVYSIFEVLKQLPNRLSEEEVEGLIKVMPADLAKSMRSMLRADIIDASLTFLRMFLVWLEEAKRAKEEGKKVLLVPFNFPPEIIHSFESLFPITSEVLSTLGVVALEGQGERYWDFAMGMGMPDHLCSSNTIELGSMLSGADFEPDGIISSAPGSCDVNSKIHEFVSLQLDIPQFLLEKPADNTRRGLQLYKIYYNQLVKELEDFSGEKLKEENLRRVAEKCNRATELYRDLWVLRGMIPCPVPGIFALYTYGARFCMWGRDEAIMVLEKLVEVSRRNLEDPDYAKRKEAARPLWIYLPYFFDFPGFFDWMEMKGYSNMGDLLMCCFPQPIDTTSRETIIEGFAEAAWNMPMTRQMGGDSMSVRWLDDIVLAVKELNADCCIYCGHHSCKQTWSIFSKVRNEIGKRAGVPTMYVQGDSWIKRMTPISVIQEEMDQFISNVMTRERKRRRTREAKA